MHKRNYIIYNKKPVVFTTGHSLLLAPLCRVLWVLNPAIACKVGTFIQRSVRQELPAAKLGSLLKSVGSKHLSRITHTVGRRRRIVAYRFVLCNLHNLKISALCKSFHKHVGAVIG